MDSALASAYQEAYNSRISAVNSFAASDALAATPSVESWRPFGHFWILLRSVLLQSYWVVRNLCLGECDVYLGSTILLVLFSCLVLLISALALLLVWSWLESPRFNKWLHERYELWTLDLHPFLQAGHRWANFRSVLCNIWLRLRYNGMADGISGILRETYFLPRTLGRLIGNHPGKVLLSGVVLFLLYLTALQTVVRPILLREFPLELTRNVPSWVLTHRTHRKSEGSNSHYFPVPLSMPMAIPVPDSKDEWMAAIGGEEHMVLEASTATVTEQDTATITATTSVAEAPPLLPTDHWTPLHGLSVLGDNYILWCRKCEQFHCCELPY